MARCECGRKVTYRVTASKRSDRKAFRKGGDKDHCMCLRCFRAYTNRLRVTDMAHTAAR